jgi:hypothetical protein
MLQGVVGLHLLQVHHINVGAGQPQLSELNKRPSGPAVALTFQSGQA